MQGIDGLILVYNSEGPSPDSELERVYKAFAQEHGLTRAQCIVLAVKCGGTLTSGKGLTGRLRALQLHSLDVQLASPQLAAQQVKGFVDQLVARCVERKGRQVEEEVIGSEP